MTWVTHGARESILIGKLLGDLRAPMQRLWLGCPVRMALKSPVRKSFAGTEYRLERPNEALTLRESFKELMKIERNWGVINVDTLTEFCVANDVPKRGENRVWDGPFQPLSKRKRVSVLQSQ